MKKKSMDWYKQQQRFSVRKYHFGAASVLLGTALVFGGAQVSADEVTAPATPSTESTTATTAETTTASEGAPAVLTASEATPASLTASEASSSTEATSLDKGALQVALSQAKALDLSNKTSETVAILLAQIEHAQTVLNTATSQEELNQAVTDLQAAQVQLADKPAQPVAVSPASVATTPAPATSTTSSTPEATTPASPATVETSSSSPVVETPTRSRRTRRAVPTGTAPIEAVDAAAQAAEKQNLENRNAQLKADYDAAVAHYNSELVRIPADNASKKATYDAAYAQYLADKKNYEDNLAANLAAAEATKNQPGHLSEVQIQHMKFDHEPNAVVDIQSTGYFREITGPTYRYGMKVGNTLTATYTGLENTSYNGRKITKVVYDYKLLSLTSPTDAIFRIAKDPTVTVYVETEDPAHALSGYSWETSLEAKFYYEDGTQVQFDSNKPAIFALNSLDGAPTYNEYVSGFSGRYVPITGSVIQGYPDGRQHANMVTATLNPFKEYMIATAGIANSGNSVKVNFGSNRTSNMYFGFNTKVESANLVQNTAVQPTVPNYETLPTAPTAPTYLTISNRLNYDPTGQDLTVKHNEVVNASDAISNKGTLPTGTTYTWKGVTPDTTTPGSKPATVTVGYPDGTSEDVAITVTVTPVSDDYTPVGKDVPAKHGDTPSAASGIANKGDLPTGTTYDWKNPVDTTTPGDKPGTVVVTYPDGTKDEVPVTVKVQPQADDYDPQAQPVSVDHGATPNAEDGIANKGTLPPGTTYDWKTPIDTSTPGTKPGTVVVTYPDGTKDEVPVPVTVKVKPQSDEFTPTGQDVPAKHGETPNAADGITNKGDLPAGTTYDWKTPVDTSTPGDKPGTVVVTYPDGTKDEVPVTVKVKPQSDEFTPTGQDVPAKHGETPNAADGIANKGDLPAGTTYDWKTPVDTTTPGDKPGTVVVTYPDGTKDEVPVTVKVKPQSDEFTPVGKDVPAKHGDTPNAADGISNKGDLPAGTTYDWKTPVDTSTPGDKPGTVVVTYPDGTKDEVPVTVKVQPQTDDYDPQAKPVAVDHGATPNAGDGIANKGDLPAGTTYDWKTPVDTSTPGTKPGTVVVTYPDGTKDEVPVPVTVGEQADLYTPVGQDVPAKHGETPAASQGIANRGTLPAGTTYDWKTPVDTSTPGDKPATVVVTYPDGSKDEVPVTVKVKPQSDEFTPNGQDVPTKHGETPNAADGIANKGDLPADTKYDWKTPVDTSTPGDKPGTVVVTYPDGTKDEVPVTVKVKPQSDEFTPAGQDVPAKHGETPKAEDGIANKGDLPDGTKYDWKTPVDTTTPGDKPGTVVVTYPDGTKDEVPVTVKVKPQSDEFTPVGKDVPAKHGETPKAEDGIANKGDLPDGTKYDWKTPVDTTTPGDKPGTVMVTYPDGTKDEVPVTVKVKPQSDEFTPQPKDVSTDHGKTPKAEDGIANKGDLPDGTKYDWKTPVDTTTPGDKPGTVVVTYPDGTKDEVPVTVHVGSQSDLYNPDGQNLNVKQGDQPEASKGIANRGNLPDGTTYDWKTPVDTSTVGDKPATVVVTYPDGSKDEVPVTVKVTEKLHVKTPADKVPVKDPSHLTPDDINKVVENIKKENPGLPDDAKITVNPNGGDTTIETKDGDKVTIPGSDLVRPETDADKNNVKVPADKVPVKDPSNLTDAEKDKVKDNIKKANPDLPNGTKIDVAKDGTATITFPDGSTKVIPGSDLVRPETDADRHTPKGQDVPVKQGETPKAEDGIANKGDLPNGTKIEWKETPDTSKVGDHNATIVITYPDGSKDEVTVTVKVSPNANNNGHNGNNGSQGNGNSGSHNNGTNGDQGQGDKDKKDQAGKDTNNGLDKLFSNSGNGSASGNQSGASRKQAPALPNTGDASNPAMALAFAALLGGTALAMKKRKKEEEE